MSKFFAGMGDGDSHGQRRQADWEYSGGVQSPLLNQPSPIEKQLAAAGMNPKEIKETSDAIVRQMQKMRDQPLEAQQTRVKMFMGRVGNPQAIENITKLAKGEPITVKPVENKVKPQVMRM